MNGVRPLEQQDIPEVVQIHREVLSDSPLVRLGPRFLEEVYYAGLIQQKGAFCLVYPLQGRLAGFICGACDAAGVTAQMLKGRFFSLLSVGIETLFRSPLQLGAIGELIRLERASSPKFLRTISAQLFSFGVLPEFRAKSVLSKLTSLRVSEMLWEGLLWEFQQKGVAAFKVITQANNTASVFYKNRGMQLVPNLTLEGGNCVYIGEIRQLSTRTLERQESQSSF